MSDFRAIGPVVAGVLRAAGDPAPVELARANDALSALGRPPLTTADFTGDSPESLALRVPSNIRESLVRLLYELAGDEPIRRRIADAYAGLWFGEAAADAERRTGTPFLRWLIGELPRHHVGVAPKENDMQSPYRNEHSEQAVPTARSPLRTRVERIRGEYLQVVEAVESVIVGKRDVIERVLTAMAARGHVLLVDVPGVGKTQLCKAIAAAIATNFGRIQFTPDLLPMDITGANVFDVKDREFRFRPGPIFTHILLADEINRATPKTQSALLEVMEERCATVDGVTHRLDEAFQVLATMNPIDHQGTYALPAAQIDRFMVMLEIGYPTPEDEVRVLDLHLGAASPLLALQPVISRASFIEWRETVPHIHVSPEIKRTVVDYINKLRRTTVDGQAISPRATRRVGSCRAGTRDGVAGREFA